MGGFNHPDGSPCTMAKNAPLNPASSGDHESQEGDGGEVRLFWRGQRAQLDHPRPPLKDPLGEHGVSCKCKYSPLQGDTEE